MVAAQEDCSFEKALTSALDNLDLGFFSIDSPIETLCLLFQLPC